MNQTHTNYFNKVMSTKGKRRICKTHPTANWGVNERTGEFYKSCRHGFLDGKECEILEEA